MIHIVLFEPEIPQNTGNIMRTCSAFKMKLHLIEPLGFELDEKHLRRAGMDYMKELDYSVYKNWDDFYERRNGQFVYFTRYALKSFVECNFDETAEDIYLVFGKESTGIDKAILKGHLDECYRIPMRSDARSLNLSNCVAIGAYECMRQIGFGDLSDREVIKGEDFLLRC
ncbi:MAG: tRNA (cytidine(34)-2'-O)-methyltransferase [Erysipelotrichaceae bacterium]|nr:tRNA (cytidine(34)-2'-O)-methyltransferase [Erysipelotrichaceae bacterium]